MDAIESLGHFLVADIAFTVLAFFFGTAVDEFEQVIDLMGQDKINADILISDIIALEEIEEQGFKRLCDDRDLIKVLVRP